MDIGYLTNEYMTQIQKLTDSQLIKYVERVGEKIRETGIVPDKWVYCRRELERRGYMYWFFTGKVILRQIFPSKEDAVKYLNQKISIQR